ncbi:hypothetical protein [Gimesia aquarii]|uniref:Uncharacterized protein n=1 Tax=Gimesia aquarii TaxID=2527964 RepID=A0A517VQJ3_9PLAN|nr:hypothetical protein [Gimesia aquarii]QDT95288.1 hypothetical protein V144x_07300 [Gimesia aquarii]
MTMHALHSYRSYDEFSELVDGLFSDNSASDAIVPTFGPKIESMEANLRCREYVKTFGPKVRTTQSSKVSNGRKKERSIYTWLRNRTSGLDYGKEIAGRKGKHPIHINKNEEVLAFFDDLRKGRRTWLEKITNQDFIDHQQKKETFYFAGDSKSKNDETLALIDIDCKKFGTLEGAMSFAKFLKEHHFPNLYIEVSTHGNGAHGYFVLEKYDYGATFINNLLLQRLQPWLRKILAEQDFDVENVEIKGTLPVVEWGDEKYEVLTYKSGTLAKLPRIETPEREEQLRNTTIVTVNDLQQLPVIEEPKVNKSAKTRNTATPHVGSISGKHISQDELGHLNGHYRQVAESLLEVHALKTSGKTVATIEDVAIFLMLLKFFTENMNTDGSLPVNRWSEMWKSVFVLGDINRAFCPQRFKTIRDHLSGLGLLDWEDETYRIGWTDEDGKYHKGKACKWRASKEFMVKLEIPVVAIVKKKEEGGTSFIRTTLIEFFKTITQLRSEDTTRPVLFDPESPLRLNPDEINHFVKPFDAYTSLAA